MLHFDIPKIGAVLRSARKAKRLTQAELAERTGASTRTIVSIENDQRFPTYEVFYRIIHVLGISADLVFWTEAAVCSTEQDQIIREFLVCNEQEQKIIMATIRALMRTLRTGSTG